MELAATAGVTVGSLSVQSTSLDDVFVHYTGRALRDALQEASPLDRRSDAEEGVAWDEPGPSSNASCGASAAARC